MTFDLYPDEWSSTRLLIMLPPWVQAGGVARLKERLADRATRARIRDEMAARGRFFAGDRDLGRTCASAPSPGRSTRAGRAGPWPTDG